jgi:hypothetical protein
MFTTASLQPPGTPPTCVFAAAPAVYGQLRVPATPSGGWVVSDGYGAWLSAGAATFNASAGSAAVDGVTPPAAAAPLSLQGCIFSLKGGEVTPAWPLLGLADAAPVGAYVSGLRGSGVALDGAAADAIATAGAGVGGAPPAAALVFALPAGHALLSWSLSLGDSSRAGAATQASPAAPLPLPPLSAPLNGAPPRPPAGAAVLLPARAHALRVRLLPSEVRDGAAAGASPAEPAVARGWRASVRGYGVVGAGGGGGGGALFPPAAAFSETFTLLLDSEDALLRTARSPRFSPLQALAFVFALLGGALVAGRLIHDGADAACECRARGERKGGSLWGLLCPCFCRAPPAPRFFASASGAGGNWAAPGVAATRNALAGYSGEERANAVVTAPTAAPTSLHPPSPPPPPAPRPMTFAREASLRFTGGLFGGEGALTPVGGEAWSRAFDRGPSPARAQLQGAAKRVAALVGFAGRFQPGAGGGGKGSEGQDASAAPAAPPAAPPAAAEAPAEQPVAHYKAAPVLGGWHGEAALNSYGHQSYLKTTQVPLHNGARPF